MVRRDTRWENPVTTIYSGDHRLQYVEQDNRPRKLPFYSHGIIRLKHPTLFENDLKIRASCRNNRHCDYRARRGSIHGKRGNHVKIKILKVAREELKKLGRIPPSMSEFTVNVCLVPASPLE